MAGPNLFKDYETKYLTGGKYKKQNIHCTSDLQQIRIALENGAWNYQPRRIVKILMPIESKVSLGEKGWG